MNKEDRQRIQTWAENELDGGDGFDDSHALLISIRKEYEAEVRGKGNIHEDNMEMIEAAFFIIASPPTFAHDIYPNSLTEWACSFYCLKPDWVIDVSVQG